PPKDVHLRRPQLVPERRAALAESREPASERARAEQPAARAEVGEEAVHLFLELLHQRQRSAEPAPPRQAGPLAPLARARNAALAITGRSRSAGAAVGSPFAHRPTGRLGLPRQVRLFTLHTSSF